jgi:lambda family phage portal protein
MPSFLERTRAAWNAFQGRASSRVVMKRTASVEVFGGAEVSRLTQDWISQTLNPNTEIRFDARFMRARARKLVRDNSFAAGYVTEFQNQVIGPKGIQLQAKITNRAGGLVESTNDEIERGWRRWGRKQFASADRRSSWLDLERLIAKSLPMDGEVFVHRMKYFANPWGFTIRLIDPDLLDETFNRPAGRGQNQISMGIELDEWGGAVAYHFWNRHPDDIYSRQRLERVVIPASEISHLFVQYRANQIRGVTWFAPIMFDLNMLGGYRKAETVAARMAAAKMGFLVNKNPELTGSGAAPSDDEDDENAEQNQLEASPGVIEELPPGFEFQGFDPTHPSTAYAAFEKAINRSMARGVNMAYTTVTGDLEAVNYSSIRAGLLSERDFHRGVQYALIEHLCEPVYLDWLSMGILTQQVRVDTRLASEYDEVEWQPRGWKWVDPLNDLQAGALAIQLGLDTRTRLAAEGGLDFESNIDRLAEEQDYAEQAGVTLGSDPAIQETKTTVEDPNARDLNQTQQTTPAKPQQPDQPAARRSPMRRLA